MAAVLSRADAKRLEQEATAQSHRDAIEAAGWTIDAEREGHILASKYEGPNSLTRVAGSSLQQLAQHIATRPPRKHPHRQRKDT